MAPAPKDDLFAAVVNFNTAELTRRCTRSLLDAGVANILVLDNASEADQYRRLEAAHAGEAAGVRVIRSETNLGFAQGCNHLIEEALRDARCGAPPARRTRPARRRSSPCPIAIRWRSRPLPLQ